jgi:hypothetical protein
LEDAAPRVRMDVDEAGRHRHSLRVDDRRRGRAIKLTDGYDRVALVADQNVGLRRLCQKK